MNNDLEPRDFEKVFAEELEAIREARKLRGRPPEEREFKDAQQAQLVGLAFSGGGIRSATFNLGILQRLAHLNLLGRFDYLSTVSGGGYIGSWLAAWIAGHGFKEVSEGLRPTLDNVNQSKEDQKKGQKEEPHPIHWLRDYSNYLTPRLGVFSGDTWAMASIYLRNLLLNLLLLVSTFGALLLVPHFIERGYDWAQTCEGLNEWVNIFFVFGILFVLWAVGITALNLVYFGCPPRLRPGGRGNWRSYYYLSQEEIQRSVVLPVFAGAFFCVYWLWVRSQQVHWEKWALTDWGYWVSAAAFLYLLCWLGGWWLERKAEQERRREGKLAEEGRDLGWRCALSFAPLAGAAGGVLLILAAPFLQHRAAEHVVAWGPPLLMMVFLAIVTFHIGLMGKNFPDYRREWLGRLGGWLLLYNLCWTGLFGAALFGPGVWDAASDFLREQLGSWAQVGAVVGWLAATIGGLLAGRSPATGGRGANPWLELGAKLTPYVFAVGLLLGLSRLVHELHGKGVGNYLGLLAACLLVGGLLAWRLDINQFSMHLFYRNRLARCYLGASVYESSAEPKSERNRKRCPQPFTGFDARDDVFLAKLLPELQYAGPYPIINTTLNLTRGKEFAWQQRKGASFVFTPKYCGYEPHLGPGGGEENEKGYRITSKYAYPGTGGPYLSSAMAISGAAASPNMGYHSSPPLAFLLTVFNVRLGSWLGNPRHATGWKKSVPRWSVRLLLNELLGWADDESEFVYLSDGGHFENLAIYELVRRRCRLIVACDAEQDGKMHFGGLGNAVEKCRTDFGIDIELRIAPLRPKEEGGPSQWHCVVGTIRYDQVDPEAKPGMLLYIKSSLTCNEPADVRSYALQNREFPHQTTADQWFDEAQFESYRKLGLHIVEAVFEEIGQPQELTGMSLERLCEKLARQWRPPTVPSEEHCT